MLFLGVFEACSLISLALSRQLMLPSSCLALGIFVPYPLKIWSSLRNISAFASCSESGFDGEAGDAICGLASILDACRLVL
jgi:hypothetical protein